jgi:hypothetical protein
MGVRPRLLSASAYAHIRAPVRFALCKKNAYYALEEPEDEPHSVILSVASMWINS